MDFIAAIDAFLSDPRTRGRLKPSTLRAYRKDLAATAGALPAELDQVTTAALAAYLAADIAPTTVARRLAALRALFGWALREGQIERDPTVPLEAPPHAPAAPADPRRRRSSGGGARNRRRPAAVPPRADHPPRDRDARRRGAGAQPGRCHT